MFELILGESKGILNVVFPEEMDDILARICLYLTFDESVGSVKDVRGSDAYVLHVLRYAPEWAVYSLVTLNLMVWTM